MRYSLIHDKNFIRLDKQSDLNRALKILKKINKNKMGILSRRENRWRHDKSKRIKTNQPKEFQ